MNARPTAPTATGHNALAAIFWAGLLCGIFDILAAFMVYGAFGLKPIPLLQGIASGVLGARARDGGSPRRFSDSSATS